MSGRSSGGGKALLKTAAAVLFALAALTASSIGGLYVGAAIFSKLEQLPSSVIGLTTLHDYWDAYGTVNHVRRALGVSSVLAGIVALMPVFIFLVVLAIGKQRYLHGNARFANVREIRASGLVEEAQ
jgi:hypothetical protein